MDSEEDSDHYEEHYGELDIDNGSSSMDDMVEHHYEYDYDDLVHHHSEYDYDDMVDHYIEHGSHTDDMEEMMAHDKDYYDYMPHQEEESHEHRSMSFEDDSERSMLKFPTLKEGPTYYGSSRSSRRHHESAITHDHHHRAQHVDHHRHSSSTSARRPHTNAKAHEPSPRHDKDLH